MKFKYLSLILIISILTVACSSETVDEENNQVVEDTLNVVVEEVSFSSDIWPVLEEFAISAHGGKGGINLENYEDIIKYIVPGNPEESDLYKRLTGDGVPVMPPSGKLSDETIQLFYNWISQGAKNN